MKGSGAVVDKFQRVSGALVVLVSRSKKRKKIFYNSCGPYVIFYIQLKIIPPYCERNGKRRKKKSA